jgi:hypothetical protein
MVSGGSIEPTGTVAITGAELGCTITLSSGSGACNSTFLTVGSKTISAVYSGDANYLSSSSTEPHLVWLIYRIYLPLMQR